jgi:hypothetical protein
MTKPLAEYSVIRVVGLTRGERPYQGTEGVERLPQVGDEGTIVFVYAPNDPDTAYAVECVDAQGYTVWLADFARAEIELVGTLR